MGVKLDDTEARQVLYCCAAELRARTEGKGPGVQPWLARLVRRLEMEVALSPSRQDCEAGDKESRHEDKWIGSREAADILGWTLRQVQRHANDLDGRPVAGKWIFRAGAVLDYAEGLKDARDSA